MAGRSVGRLGLDMWAIDLCPIPYNRTRTKKNTQQTPPLHSTDVWVCMLTIYIAHVLCACLNVWNVVDGYFDSLFFFFGVFGFWWFSAWHKIKSAVAFDGGEDGYWCCCSMLVKNDDDNNNREHFIEVTNILWHSASHLAFLNKATTSTTFVPQIDYFDT